MKKILVLIAVLAIATTTDAKIRLGVKGGLNFANFSVSDVSLDGRTGWHAGGMMNIGLPLGLRLQPELIYSSKGSEDSSVGYIEIPVDLQWGIKLPLLRPYVSVTPYASYRTNSNNSALDANSWDGGIGLGAGVDVWKFQVALKYMWGFGNVSGISGMPSVHNRNIMLSLGIFL